MGLEDVLKKLLPALTPEEAAKTPSGARKVSKTEPEEQEAEANYLPLLVIISGLALVAWAMMKPPGSESAGDLRALLTSREEEMQQQNSPEQNSEESLLEPFPGW